jgi:hypothetical protein
MFKASFDVIAACKPVAPKIAAKTVALNTLLIVCPFYFLFPTHCLDERIIKVLNEARMNGGKFILTSPNMNI